MSQWVQVPPEAARAHPKGRPGPVEWAIAAFFLYLAVVYLRPFLGGLGAAPVWHILWGFLCLNAGVLLAMGSPLGRPLGLLMGFREVLMFMLVIGNNVIDTDSGALPVFTTASVWTLIHAIGGFVAAFHLMLGDRPNLIYRHRYRKYSADV